jgi:thymidylate kinase
MTFSLLHATDFADRLLYRIVPPLKAGMIVLADRYSYTAFARDVARGLDRTRFGVVKSLEPVLSEDRLLLRLDIGGADAELELWAAARRSELLARLLERPLELRPVPGHALEPAPAVARRA